MIDGRFAERGSQGDSRRWPGASARDGRSSAWATPDGRPGQLDAELGHGVWGVAPADERLVFDEDRSEVDRGDDPPTLLISSAIDLERRTPS